LLHVPIERANVNIILNERKQTIIKMKMLKRQRLLVVKMSSQCFCCSVYNITSEWKQLTMNIFYTRQKNNQAQGTFIIWTTYQHFGTGYFWLLIYKTNHSMNDIFFKRFSFSWKNQISRKSQHGWYFATILDSAAILNFHDRFWL
jgi:hypothetical protein